MTYSLVTREKVLADMQRFSENTGVALTQLGVDAVGDPSFYGRMLSDERSPTLRRLEKLYEYMNAHDNSVEGVYDIFS